MMTNTAVTTNSDIVGSYAMLKSIWTESDYFVPFERLLLTLLYNKKLSQVDDLQSFCKDFKEYWHIEVTYMAMQFLFSRLIKEGCINKSNLVFHVHLDKFDKSKLIPSEEIEAYETDYDALIYDCQKYVSRETQRVFLRYAYRFNKAERRVS